ncbi:MAG: hypothetical protein KAJ29_00840 [Alphaproteobacteria bacterium]|nr:hypothetical protein [Alphaproteobacteria bacterium]
MKLSMKKVISFCLVITSFISLGLILVTSGQVQAVSVIADSPCDPLYYESLSARAWLEAQREITQNQNLILKPDSVFEYTCFDRLVRELADHADEMFSETPSYGGPLNAASMDNALQALVGTSLDTYISNNFGGAVYNLLAGHPAAVGIFHDPRPITNAIPYSCDIMGRVWHAAKCINFISDSSTDGFYTFQEYATNPADKRHLPTACVPIMVNWNINLLRALTSGNWTQDPVQTYFSLTEPIDCVGVTCPCSTAPIPTGIKVIRTGYDNSEYDEYICLQPGCHYHPGVDDLATGIPDPGAGCYGR